MAFNKEKRRKCDADYHRRYFQTRRGKYQDYKNTAKKRGIEFKLTEEEFLLFWQKPCRYCGSEMITIGLDRVDSDMGYIIDNIVPCCRTCNWMKKNIPKEIFIEHCRKIVTFSDKE